MTATPPTHRKINRREFLGLLGLAAVAAWIGKLFQTLLDFSHPPKLRNQAGGVFDLGNYTDLGLQAEAPQRFPQGRFWLVQAPDGVVALNGTCTHLDWLFDWDTTEQRFVCPCHGSQFSLDGACLSGPATRNLDRFVVRFLDEEGGLVSETDRSTGYPLALPGPTPTPSDEASVTLPPLRLEVDTGFKIRGQDI